MLDGRRSPGVGPADGDAPLDAAAGLELHAAAGACDIKLIIHHDDTYTGEDELPSALLHTLAKELPYGAFRLPRLYKALRVLPDGKHNLHLRYADEVNAMIKAFVAGEKVPDAPPPAAKL